MKFGNFALSTLQGLAPHLKVDYDESLFEDLVNFVVSFHPDQLTVEQQAKIVEIISSFKMISEKSEVCKKLYPIFEKYYTENEKEFKRADTNRGWGW